MDLCRAHCTNPALTQLFDCPYPIDHAKCKADCKKRAFPAPTCEQQCPVYKREPLMCASNGQLYMDLCRARCVDPSLTQILACPFPINRAQCQADCKARTSDDNGPRKCFSKCMRQSSGQCGPLNGQRKVNCCNSKCKPKEIGIIIGSAN